MSGPVAIFGAGAAGVAAALAAARSGAEVLLLEAGQIAGGTVVQALIHTLGGFHDHAGRILNPGLSEELLGRLQYADPTAAIRRMGRLWVFSVDPGSYARAIGEWIAGTPRIRFCPGAELLSHRLSGAVVAGLRVRTAGEILRIRPHAVVDATGNAGLLRRIAPHLVCDDPAPAARGLVFRAVGAAEGCCDFPRGTALLAAIRSAVDAGRLPLPCARVWIDRGARPGEVYFKWTLPPSPDAGRARIDEPAPKELVASQRELLAFLRACDPGFAQARIEAAGRIGIRDAGSAMGRYRLTEADLLAARTFPDPACRCAWPIEHWDPEAGVRLSHLPRGAAYQIPFRSLEPKGLANVWVAGKCFSGDRFARASARVAGCCFAMGEAAGNAASGLERCPESLVQAEGLLYGRGDRRPDR